MINKEEIDKEVDEWYSQHSSIRSNATDTKESAVSVGQILDTTNRLIDKLVNYGKHESS